MKKNLEQGTALITALFIMAIIASASVAMLWRQQITIVRTASILNYNKAYLISGGVLDWARTSLAYNFDNQSDNSLVDHFPLVYKKVTFPEGYFQGYIVDEQSKFNLNNLDKPEYGAGFINLLKQVLPNLQSPETLLQAIVDWLTYAGGHSLQVDNAYKKANLSYVPAHQLMVDISELRFVLGVTSDMYEALKPYITVLPDLTPININTASAPVLMTLSPSIDIQTAQTIVKNRLKTPYLSVSDFLQDPVVKNHGISHSSGVTVTSQYFLSHAVVQWSDEKLVVNSLLRRETEKNKRTKVSVLWQSQA